MFTVLMLCVNWCVMNPVNESIHVAEYPNFFGISEFSH